MSRNFAAQSSRMFYTISDLLYKPIGINKNHSRPRRLGGLALEVAGENIPRVDILRERDRPLRAGDSHDLRAAESRPMLQHELRLLPRVTLSISGALGSACRARFHVRSLREVAEYVRECDNGAGETPDSLESLLSDRSGTIGAKQALLAALAAEAGRPDVRLVVGCCEMRTEGFASKPGLTRLNTLPLAVCWLKYKGRRLQIVEPEQASLQAAKLVTEIEVHAERLPSERLRLFEAFATDWCRAFDVSSLEFAELRASQLIRSAGTSVFEDLLGYGLPPDYAPEA